VHFDGADVQLVGAVLQLGALSNEFTNAGVQIEGIARIGGPGTQPASKYAQLGSAGAQLEGAGAEVSGGATSSRSVRRTHAGKYWVARFCPLLRIFSAVISLLMG
jgi:hypothetical protein